MTRVELDHDLHVASAAPPDAAPVALAPSVAAGIWEEHRGWIAAVLQAHKPRRAELEDLLQEVATTLISRGGTIRDAAAARGWLRTVTVNVARQAARRMNARGEGRHVDLDPAELARTGRGADARTAGGTANGPANGPDRHDDGGDAALNDVLARLDELPGEYREPLLLRAVRGLPSAVIGDMLGISEAAVNTRVARARRMLRTVKKG